MMERFVFIHGSSVGQSTFIPADAPSAICNDVANKYFQGRTLRQKESAAKLALFVDLYKTFQRENYCIFSFVNNDCRGANGREGQYFAVSILCKDVYVYPETIYIMLHSAYSQMFATGKIIGVNEEGEEQYAISQFNEQKEYLSAFLKKVESFFDEITSGLSMNIDSNAYVADYDSWHGSKVNLEVCNSMTSYKNLCATGRLYISEEYESPSEKVQTLEEQLRILKMEKAEKEQHYVEAKRAANSQLHNEIEDLKSQIQQKEKEISSLRSENDDYQATIEIVRNNLERYAKIGRSISNVQEKKTQYQAKEKKDILKACLLFLVLSLTIISSILGFCFFRYISPSLEKEIGEMDTTEGVDSLEQLTLIPSIVPCYSKAGRYAVAIKTKGDWNAPKRNDWIKFEKKDGDSLIINVSPNNGNGNREYIATIGANNQQIRITQTCQKYDETLHYRLVVMKGDSILGKGTTVSVNDTLDAIVMDFVNAKEFGWKTDDKCTILEKENVMRVRVVMKEKGDGVTFSYGNITTSDAPRQRFKCKVK